MVRRTGVLAAFGALLSGCSATVGLNALVPESTYQGQEGIAYGTDSRQKLDVFKPIGAAASAPVVVFFTAAAGAPARVPTTALSAKRWPPTG